VSGVVLDTPVQLHEDHSNTETQTPLFFTKVLSLVEVGVSLLTEVVQSVYQLIDSFLSLLTLGLFRAHSFLSKASWLAKSFAKTFFGSQFLNTRAVSSFEGGGGVFEKLLHSFAVVTHDSLAAGFLLVNESIYFSHLSFVPSNLFTRVGSYFQDFASRSI
jgi:hypothetical protein